MLQRIPDTLVLKPSVDAIDAPGATRSTLDTAAGPCSLWRRPPSGRRELLLVKIPGAGGRAERAVLQPPAFWDDLAIETWALNPPGFGDSPGRARLRNVVPCAQAVLEAAFREDCPVLLAGNSLGGLAALLVAHRFPLCGLIVRNPPPLRSVIRSRRAWWNGWLGAYLIASLVPGQLERHDVVRQTKIPAVFIRSLKDRVVPAPLQQRLIDAYSGPKQQLNLPDADHDATMDPTEQEQFLQHLAWLRQQWRGAEKEDATARVGRGI